MGAILLLQLPKTGPFFVPVQCAVPSHSRQWHLVAFRLCIWIPMPKSYIKF